MAKSKSLIDSFLTAQQTVRAEQNHRNMEALLRQQDSQRQQLSQLLDAQRKLNDRAAEQRQIKQHMFQLRQDAEDIARQQDIFTRCFGLLDILITAREFDTSQLDELGDKQWHSETTRLIEGWYSISATSLSGEAPQLIVQLWTAASQLSIFAKTLVDYDSKLRKTRLADSDVSTWAAMLAEARSRIEQIQELETHIPGASLDNIPAGKIVAAIRDFFLVPTANQLFAFKCMILVAKADDALDSAERALLLECARQLRMRPVDAIAAIDETQSVSKGEFVGDEAEAISLLQNLFRCASIDGRIASRERRIIEKIGRAIGVTSDAIGHFAEGNDVETAYTVLDHEAVLKKFTSADERLRENSYCGQDISDSLISWFAERIPSVAVEIPVVAAEWSKRSVAALLTNKHLYVIQFDKVRLAVDCSQVTGFSGGVFSGKIKLADGSTAKVSGLLNDTLSALIPAIIAARREA